MSSITQLLGQRDSTEQWQKQWGASKLIPLSRGCSPQPPIAMRDSRPNVTGYIS